MTIKIDDSKIINQEVHLNFVEKMETDEIILKYKRELLNKEITESDYEQLVGLRQKLLLKEGDKMRDPE